MAICWKWSWLFFPPGCPVSHTCWPPCFCERHVKCMIWFLQDVGSMLTLWLLMSRRADQQHQGRHPSFFGGCSFKSHYLASNDHQDSSGRAYCERTMNLCALENGKSCEGHPKALGWGAGPRCLFVANEGAVPSQAQRRCALSRSLQAQKVLSQLLSHLAERLPLRRAERSPALQCSLKLFSVQIYMGSSRAVKKNVFLKNNCVQNDTYAT